MDWSVPAPLRNESCLPSWRYGTLGRPMKTKGI
jgi:hypothetical protein